MVTTKSLIQLASDLPSALRVAQARAHTTGNTWTTEQVERVWLARTHASQTQAPAPKPAKYVPVPVVGYVPRTVRVLVYEGDQAQYVAYLRLLRATVGKLGATTTHAALDSLPCTLTQSQVTRLATGKSVTVWAGFPSRSRKLVPAPLAA
jgi:hypothetical protein